MPSQYQTRNVWCQICGRVGEDCLNRPCRKRERERWREQSGLITLAWLRIEPWASVSWVGDDGQVGGWLWVES